MGHQRPWARIQRWELRFLHVALAPAFSRSHSEGIANALTHREAGLQGQSDQDIPTVGAAVPPRCAGSEFCGRVIARERYYTTGIKFTCKQPPAAQSTIEKWERRLTSPSEGRANACLPMQVNVQTAPPSQTGQADPSIQHPALIAAAGVAKNDTGHSSLAFFTVPPLHCPASSLLFSSEPTQPDCTRSSHERRPL